MTGPGPSDPAGQAPPPPDPAAPQAQGQSPEWATKAQEWRPATVVAGPAAGIAYADLTTRIVA